MQELCHFPVGVQTSGGAGPPGTSVTVYATSAAPGVTVAREIAELIRAKAARGELAVLGLATGSTPQGTYDELVRLHREEGLSFRNVVTFNLDEYWPMQPEALQSYHRFMAEYLFDHKVTRLDAASDFFVAYQTSGNIAVFDDEALRDTDLVTEFCQVFTLLSEREAKRIEDAVQSFVGEKQPGEVESPALQKIKTLMAKQDSFGEELHDVPPRGDL